MRDYIDRNEAAALLGMTRHYMEKHRGRPGFPRVTRYGRKVWYRRAEVEDWGKRLRQDATRGVRNGNAPAPDPTDEEIAAARGEAPIYDECPWVTALLTIARKLGTVSAHRVRFAAEVDEWPSGMYDTPQGVLIRRKT